MAGVSGEMVDDSWEICSLTRVASRQRLPPLRGVQRHFLGKDSNLTQDGTSFRETTCSITAASFLATVTLERRGILFRILIGLLNNLTNESISSWKSIDGISELGILGWGSMGALSTLTIGSTAGNARRT
jgi:hypothetical protein